MLQKRTIILIGCIVIIAVAVLLIYFGAQGKKYSDNHTPVDVLKAQNQNFAAGQQAERQGNYAQAQQDYEAALPAAQDASQKATIEYSIGVSDEHLGNYAQAISQFKTIVVDPSTQGLIIRAYAVQEMGYMYYSNDYNTSAAQSIYTATFAAPPYSSLSVATSTALSYRNLFAYANTLYPLGYSEARVASWYANDLVSMNGATTTAQGKVDVAAVLAALKAADADNTRTQNQPNVAGAISTALNLEGTALGRLANFGAANPQQVETYFQQAIQYATTAGLQTARFPNYNYALFLARQYGISRATDIAKLLAPFSAANSATINTSVVQFLKVARTGASYASQKQGVLLLAKLDPAFKTYLMSLGWHASDF